MHVGRVARAHVCRAEQKGGGRERASGEERKTRSARSGNSFKVQNQFACRPDGKEPVGQRTSSTSKALRWTRRTSSSIPPGIGNVDTYYISGLLFV